MKKLLALFVFLLIAIGGWAQSEQWEELLTNGDAESPWGSLAEVAYNDAENNYKVCAWARERQSDPFPATIEDEGNGNQIFVVHAMDCVNPAEDASAWDNQFWIESSKPFEAGEKIKIHFRYKASQACRVSTEMHHQTPSDYQIWYALGNVSFTTEWKVFDQVITIDNEQDNAWSIVFTLNAEIKSATDFYFDDISLSRQAKWIEFLANGDAESPWGSLADVAYNDKKNNYKVCAWAKERQSNPFPATIEDEGNGNHVFVVHAKDCVDPDDDASAWDNQFWIESPQPWQEGLQVLVSFRYKASQACRVSTQMHHQTPSDYQIWYAVGNVDFTTEWQVFEKTITIDSEQHNAWSIAFNLNSEIKTATDFYFDDLSLKIEKGNLPEDSENGKLVINEIMQSNIDCIMDDQNEFPDSWVELYNAGTGSDNLRNYKIGLTANINEAWPLATAIVSPTGMAIIYCDNSADKNHTNFRLDPDEGGAVYLFKNGMIVDRFENIPKQPAPNISYGRKDESSDELGFQYTPTPSRANCGTLCSKVLGEPVFSEQGFVANSSQQITLILTMPEGTPEGAFITYTTDGTEPTASCTLYTGAISFKPSCVVRAKIFCEGYLSPRSTVQSYINHGRDVTLPVVSMVTDGDYFYDEQKGIYVTGAYSSSQSNYKYNWRRPVNVEYFEPSEEGSVINQLCETRVCGAYSREFELKSLIVYANKRFGKKRLVHEFFPTQRPGIKKFKSIIIRNAGNDFYYLYLRDAAVQRSMGEYADLDWQAWQPAILYLNGKYIGILNIRERSNEDNVWENYEGLEDIDLFENGTAKVGNYNDYNYLNSFSESKEHTYDEYANLMDINEFQNYNLMQLFYNNRDWPGNNRVMWKPHTEGGKWRWLVKDADYGLGLYGTPADYNTIEWFYDNSYDSSCAWANYSGATRLMRRLMDIEQFKWEFLDKLVVYTGDFLSSKRVNALLDEMSNEIKYEYPYHRSANYSGSFNYESSLNEAKNWMSERTNHFFTQLINKYQLPSTVFGAINDSLPSSIHEMMDITVNDIPLTNGNFDGRFFTGRPLHLNGTYKDESKEITGWTVSTIVDGKVSSVILEGNDVVYIPSEATFVSFNANISWATGIERLANENQFSVYADEDHLHIECSKEENVSVYDINGRLVYSETQSKNAAIPLRRGLYVVKCGSKSKKIVVE